MVSLWLFQAEMVDSAVMTFHISLSKFCKVVVGQPGNWDLTATGGKYFLFLTFYRKLYGAIPALVL